MDFSNLSPEDIQQLSELLSNQDQVGDLNKDTDYQHQLQAGLRPPEGRQAGRVYVAANPLEHLGNLLQTLQSQKAVKSDDAQIKGLRDKINLGRAAGIRGIAGLGQTQGVAGMYDRMGHLITGPNEQT